MEASCQPPGGGTAEATSGIPLRGAPPTAGALAETGLEVGERTRSAWGHRAPDLLLRGARVLLADGTVERLDVGIVGRRIAVLGEELVWPGEASVDLGGKTLVPGFVEPHAHTLGPLSVGSYCGQALAHGTTCVVSDDSFAYTFLPAESYPAMLDVSTRVPMVLRWSLRLETPRTLPYSGVIELLDREDVVQVGEVMTRQALVEPAPEICEVLAAARSRGLRVEGHSPGASRGTLQAGAAAGLTADHESVRGEEIGERLRLGLWAFIRYTDVLRDAPAIVAWMSDAGASFERTAFTSDWALPPWMAARGTIDAALRAALEAGLGPGQAYACATLRPATYLGLDAHLGALAPGRLACLNVLADLAEPTPERVFSLGREVARGGELVVDFPDVPWAELQAPPWTTRPAGPPASAYELAPDDPAIFLEAASMIRAGAGPGGPPIACASLHEPTETMARAAIHGFPRGLEGIASTLTPRRLMIALGASPEGVARCVDTVVAAGGGIAYQVGGELRALPMPVGGAVSGESFAAVAEFWAETERAFADLGHRFPDPLSTLLYIGSSGLPGARFAEQGLIDTRRGALLAPARRVPWRQ